MRSLWYNKAKESDRMKKILAALAVLAVIAAGTATALFQQLQPEEYESVDAAVNANKSADAMIYDKFELGDDYIIVLYEPQMDAYRFADIRKSGDGYLVKSLSSAGKSPTQFSYQIQYSKKETAIVTLTPDETGKMVASLKIETK